MAEETEKGKIKITVDIAVSELRDDRGFGDIYPEGTKSRALEIRNKENDAVIHVIMYFAPEGKRYFTIMSKTLCDKLMAYSSDEFNLINVATRFVSEHKKDLYPESHLAMFAKEQLDACIPLQMASSGKADS